MCNPALLQAETLLRDTCVAEEKKARLLAKARRARSQMRRLELEADANELGWVVVELTRQFDEALGQ